MLALAAASTVRALPSWVICRWRRLQLAARLRELEALSLRRQQTQLMIETPYRNGRCARPYWARSAGHTLQSQWVLTFCRAVGRAATVADWKRSGRSLPDKGARRLRACWPGCRNNQTDSTGALGLPPKRGHLTLGLDIGRRAFWATGLLTPCPSPRRPAPPTFGRLVGACQRTGPLTTPTGRNGTAGARRGRFLGWGLFAAAARFKARPLGLRLEGSTSTLRLMSFSMSATKRASARVTGVTARPDAPARPVRPMRWT